jgi:hypothetical protein
VGSHGDFRQALGASGGDWGLFRAVRGETPSRVTEKGVERPG